MLAWASIRVSDGKFFFRPTVKVTNPWPVVPLFGGRKPIRGSSGGSPARKRGKNAEPRKTPSRTSVRSSLTLNRAKYKTQGPKKVDKQLFSIFQLLFVWQLIPEYRAMMICNVRNIKLALFHSSTYTSFFNRITGHNGTLSLSCFLQITFKQCFRRSSGLNGFSVPFYYFRLKNSILDIIKNEFCSYCLFA